MNAINVQCSECKSRFAAKPHLAGKRVKCPTCKTPLTIPKLNTGVVVAEVVEDEPEEWLSASDVIESSSSGSVFDEVSMQNSSRSSSQGASPFASAGQSSGTAPSPFGSFGNSTFSATSPSVDYAGLLQRHWPSILVCIVALISLVLFLNAGYGLVGLGSLVVGALVGGLGFLMPPPEQRAKGNAGTKVASAAAGVLITIALIAARVLGRIGRREDAQWVGIGLAIVVGLAVMIGLLILMIYILARFGFVRAGACFYLFVALITPVVLSSGLGRGAAVAQRQEVPSLTVAAFPDLGVPRRAAAGVDYYDVRLSVPPGQPGHANRLYVYLPQGSNATGSLPCVFICGAGARPMTGMNLSSEDQPEHIPYAQAGFAVVAYEVDGMLPPSDDISNAQYVNGVERYWLADAGLVNARNAIDYALAKVPAIDPQRLYSAGHSSAATQSVLVAANDPRIRGCIAYAGVYDLKEYLAEDMPVLRRLISNVDDVIARGSPRESEARLACPVFLFHARDDDVVPISESIKLEQRLRQAGKDVKLMQVARGGHYDSMINEGIPAGIEWLEKTSGYRRSTNLAAADTHRPPGTSGGLSGFGTGRRPPGLELANDPDRGRPGRGFGGLPRRPGMPGFPGQTGLPPTPGTPGDDESPFKPFTPPGASEGSANVAAGTGGTGGTGAALSESPSGESASSGDGSSASPFREMDSGNSAPTATSASDRQVQQLLDRLASARGFDQRHVLDEITRIDPASVESDEIRSAVVEKLNEMAIGAENFTQGEVIKALAKWGDSSSVSVLTGILADDGSRFVKRDVYTALARLKDPASAMTVAERLADFFERDDAEQCLRQMGPVAEEAVMIVARAGNKDVCIRALNVLGDIGTENCFALLREAQSNRDVQIREAGKLALRKIRYRQKATEEQDDEKKN